MLCSLQYLILKREKVESEAVNTTVDAPAVEAQTSQVDNSAPTPPSVTKDPAVGAAWKLITNQWQLEEPKMIISVTGGARRFYMKQRLLRSFKRGLMKAAIASGERYRSYFVTKFQSNLRGYSLKLA